MFHRCSKMFLIVLNRLPRLLDLRQRTDPVIVFRNVRIVNGAIVLCHFQGAVSHKAPKAPSLSSGEIQKGARRPPLVVSIREVRRRGRKRNLPLLRVVFFASFLLDKQKNADQWSALLSRSCRAVFVCFSFPSRGIGKRKHRVRQCLYWLTQSPPGLRCFSGAAGQIRTATAHRA